MNLLPIWSIVTVSLLARALAQPADCLEPHLSLLQEYKAFHNTYKHHPDAQYLVQTCWEASCQGTGDRVRGTLFLLRIAITHKKILLVDWTRPAAITNFLLPNEIDWTFSGFPDGYFLSDNTISYDVFHDAVYDGNPDAVQQFHTTKTFVTSTNEHFYINLMANVTPVHYDRKVDIGSCYYNFMFKMNDTIIHRAEQHLRQFYGPNPGDYLAWHWRHYDADWETEEPILVSHLVSTMSCAEKLAREAGVNLMEKPVLLITDFNIFRHFVANGHLRRVVTANITARHLDKYIADEHSLDVFTGVFEDLYLMSHARCLLTSRSGFSKLALWMAGGQLLRCHRDMVTCKEETVWR